MAEDRARRFGEELAGHRERTPFGEVDLLLRTRSGSLTIIEVKTWSGAQWSQRPLTRRQERRLIRARLYLESKQTVPVKLVLALVKYEGANTAISYLDFPLEG